MTGNFAEIETIAGALLRQLAPPARRALLRRMAREVQASQAARIGRQQSPEGQRYTPRRPRSDLKPGNFAVRFLYPDSGNEPRLVFMKSWARRGPKIVGFDIETGGIASFFYERIVKWLPVAREEQNKGAGKFRRGGTIRQRAMFRKLANRRFLRGDATDREAWIGFTGRASEIAQVHQTGGMDRPSAKAKPVRYAERGLLGLTQAEQTRALDLLLDTVVSAID